MLFRAQILVRVLPEVLDPHGVAVGETLRSMGFDAVRDVRLGRLIELTVDTEASADEAIRRGDPTALRDHVGELCHALLVHEVVERAEVLAITPLATAPKEQPT